MHVPGISRTRRKKEVEQKGSETKDRNTSQEGFSRTCLIKRKGAEKGMRATTPGKKFGGEKSSINKRRTSASPITSDKRQPSSSKSGGKATRNKHQATRHILGGEQKNARLPTGTFVLPLNH